MAHCQRHHGVGHSIFQNNKRLFIAVNPINACNLGFSDHLYLPFIDPTQSDVVFFAIIYICTYINHFTTWKHGISTNYIIVFNENLENIST